jgi:FtsH-binding integral membrane protein
LFSRIYLPVFWTVLIQLLLVLPGSNFPSIGLFGIAHFDKLAHVILFGCFVGFWCYYFYRKGLSPEKLKMNFFLVFLVAALNGIVMEFVQLKFIPHRSFDEGDIVANLMAAGIAYGICNIKLLKIN